MMPLVAGQPATSQYNSHPWRTQAFGGQGVIWPLLFLLATDIHTPPFLRTCRDPPLLRSHPVLHPARSAGTHHEEQPFPSSISEALQDIVSQALKRSHLPSIHSIYTVVIKQGPEKHKERKTPPTACLLKGNAAHTTNILFSIFFLQSYSLRDTQFAFPVPTDDSLLFVRLHNMGSHLFGP